MERIIEHLCLEDCEWALEWMEDNGKIRDLENSKDTQRKNFKIR